MKHWLNIKYTCTKWELFFFLDTILKFEQQLARQSKCRRLVRVSGSWTSKSTGSFLNTFCTKLGHSGDFMIKNKLLSTQISIQKSWN